MSLTITSPSFDRIYTMYAWRDNNIRLVLTQGEGLTALDGTVAHVKAPKFQLRDERGVIDLTSCEVSLALTRPDGSEDLLACSSASGEAAQGIISCPITASATAIAGQATGEIRVLSTNGVIKFYGVYFKIYKGVSDAAAEQTSQFSALTEALIQVEGVRQMGSSNLINIEAFGAVADSAAAADGNTAIIAQAITAAKEQQRGIIIPAKTFYISDEILVSGLDGIEITNYGVLKRLPNGGSTENAILYIANSHDVRIKGGVYDGSGRAECGIVINNAPDSEISEVVVKNIGNESHDHAVGISLIGDCSYSRISNVTVNKVCAGTPTTADGYIFAAGIKVTKSLAYSKNVIIENSLISDIGYRYDNNTQLNYVIAEKGEDNNYYVNGIACKNDILINKEFETGKAWARIDGDGIHLSQKPTENDECESFITIRNPQINNCSKRAIKVATRCVDIVGGNIDVSSWSAAIELQYPRNTTVDGVFVKNRSYTCIAANGGDGILTIEGCKLSTENGSGQGITLSSDNSSDGTGENVVIKNCAFDDVDTAVCALINSVGAPTVNTSSLRVKDCLIGHYKGKAAIYLYPKSGLPSNYKCRFSTIKNLAIEGLVFKYGSSSSSVFAANAEFYNNESESNQEIIYLGEPSAYLNPTISLTIDIPEITDDFFNLLKKYTFDAHYVYLGGVPARSDYVYVYDYPELLEINLQEETLSDDGITCNITGTNNITIAATEATGIRRLWIPLKTPILFNVDEVYDFVITANQENSSQVSARLYTTNTMSSSNMITIAGLNSSPRHVLITDTSQTATYLAIVCSPSEGSSVGIIAGTELSLSLKSRKPTVNINVPALTQQDKEDIADIVIEKLAATNAEQ